jgi:hypothetical protein
MIKSDRFRLSKDTFGVRLEEGKPGDTVLIPGDAVIEIIGAVDRNNMIEVDWLGFHVVVFAADIQDCGELVGRAYAA